MNDNFGVLQVLTGWIQRMGQRKAYSIENGVLNKEDFKYNTALHLAAYKNDHQAVRLLLECRLVERNEVNGDGLTFLDILRNQGQRAAGGDLRSQGQRAVGGDLDLEQVVLKTGCKEAASVPKSKARSTSMRCLRSNASDEARGVFLIVCTLIITTTYQTALQPPGGVNQSEGHAVMKQTFCILLWVSNTVGFCCAIFYTFCLIPLGSLFAIWFFWIGSSLCISYALAMAVISPHPLVFLSVTFSFFLVFALIIPWNMFLSHWRKHRTVATGLRLRLSHSIGRFDKQNPYCNVALQHMTFLL
uniref:PGG domain-containing protein n=1 Tax=Noccaea caerulescens TaxID=107243 RepID=A0A1J3IGF7_NOCCA